MNAPDTPLAPRRGRLLRLAALALQSVVVASLLSLGLLGSIPPLRDWAFGLFPLGGFGVHHTSPAVLALCVAAWAFLAALSLLAGWLLQSRSWARIALGYAALGALLAYLAHDESTYRRPVTMEEISPVFPGAEASYATLMEYGKYHPLGKAFRSPSFENPYPKLNPTEPAEWRESITRHRTEIESHWAAFTNERAWWTQLSSFDRIGDLTPARFDAEIMTFQVVRSLTQHGLAVASLEALDGRGDEAVDTLVPILKVGHNLQPYSRTLVRDMMGCVVERISLGTASFILDHATVSPAARDRLVAALPENDPETGARHLFSMEYAFDFGTMGSARAGDILFEAGNIPDKAWLRTCLNAISPLLYNPHSTLNRIGDLYADWQEVAAHRRLDQLDPSWKAFSEGESRPSMKNLLGRWVELQTIPAYNKVAENYWKVQDQRAELRKRLASL